jgi:Transposase
MLAEVVDAVIGIDTHRDNHEVEIADLRGTAIATVRIGNDSAGFTELLAAVAELAPGPRLAVSLEGSRSYGIGLARALSASMEVRPADTAGMLLGSTSYLVQVDHDLGIGRQSDLVPVDEDRLATARGG